jgi:uncharacterized protein YndB with AHSA1/START domain
MEAATTRQGRLEIRRTIAAPRERIFHAWTTVEGLKRWFAPGDAIVAAAVADVHPGGNWSITMRGPGGEEYHVAGVYVEVDPPARLSFTWRWSHEAEDAVSRVTITLRSVAGGTELVLTHEGLSPESAVGHEQGWVSSLGKLAAECESTHGA